MRKVLLALVVLVLALATASCGAPGANPSQGGSGESGSGGGGGGEDTSSGQEVEEQTSSESGGQAESCDTEPPDLTLEEAVVGFSQSESETNPFRIAETQSIRDEAEARGVERLIVTNAETQASKQLSDVQDLLAQGAEILIIAPLNAEGLEPAFEQAAEQNVPVFLIDREVTAEPCENYVAFMGSNFLRQGEQAADLLAEATNEEAQVAILEGTPGASVATDRQDGFVQRLEEAYPNMEVAASQTGNFLRTDGQTVMEQLLQSNPDINAVYAHNDEMALGALQAIRAAGKTPGEDIKVVSIDGTRGAVEALANGQMNGVVETDPRFGPLAFDTIEQYLSGEPVPTNIIVKDDIYTPENAEENLGETY